MATFKPAIPEPGHKTPATTEIPRESARNAQAALCDGFINVEGNTAVEFAQWPVEKITFIRRDRERSAWRNKKTWRFVKKPTVQQMAKWSVVQGHHFHVDPK